MPLNCELPQDPRTKFVNYWYLGTGTMVPFYIKIKIVPGMVQIWPYYYYSTSIINPCKLQQYIYYSSTAVQLYSCSSYLSSMLSSSASTVPKCMIQ